MSHSDDTGTPQDLGWLERPSTHTLLFRVLAGVCAALVVWEVAFVHGHPHFGFDALPAFNGVFGFVAFATVVALGTQLRKLILRPEDYYEPQTPDGPGDSA